MTERVDWNRRIDQASYKAQEAILDETMSDFRKDVIVDESVLELRVIAEEKAEYYATNGPAKTARGRNRRLFGQ